MSTFPAPARQRFSPASIVKARHLVAEGRINADAAYPTTVWHVEGSAGTRYRVQAEDAARPSWVTCTCPHGRTSGAGNARCYHAIAALLLLNQVRREEGDL